MPRMGWAWGFWWVDCRFLHEHDNTDAASPPFPILFFDLVFRFVNYEALIGVFGSKGAWPKKGREQGSMNEKFGSLGAQEFFWEIILKILCLSVKFLALSNDCKDSERKKGKNNDGFNFNPIS